MTPVVKELMMKALESGFEVNCRSGGRNLS